MAPCVQPTLSEVNWDTNARVLVLDGIVGQCAPVVAAGGFRIATYRPGRATGDAPGYNVRLFPSAAVGTVRLFGAAVVPSTPGEYGVCVLAGADDRVHCGLVTVTKQAGSTVPRAVLWPLPTDAPLVARDVVAGTFTGEIGPPPGDFGGNCGTCF